MILALLALNGYLKTAYVLSVLGVSCQCLLILNGKEDTTKEWSQESRTIFSSIALPLGIALNIWFVNYLTSFIS